MNFNNHRKFEPTTYPPCENLEDLDLNSKRPRSDSEYSNVTVGSESGEDYKYEHSGFALKNFEFYFGPDKVLESEFDEESDDELLAEAENYAREFGGRCLSEYCPSNSTKLLFECPMKHTWEMTLNNLHPCIKCT